MDELSRKGRITRVAKGEVKFCTSGSADTDVEMTSLEESRRLKGSSHSDA